MPERFVRSEITQRIINYLHPHDKGTLINYQELSRAIEAPIRSTDPKLRSAMEILRKEFNQIWSCVRPKIGVRRYRDPEIVERIDGFHMKGAKRKIKRGDKNADVVEIKQLDPSQLRHFASNAIQRELVLEALSRQTYRKIERVSRGTSNDLPTFSAVEWAINLTRKNK
jgi:hypothetical protein